jgi:hypothetical protein
MELDAAAAAAAAIVTSLFDVAGLPAATDGARSAVGLVVGFLLLLDGVEEAVAATIIKDESSVVGC